MMLFYYCSGWVGGGWVGGWACGGGSNETKSILISTLVEIVVEVEVELGNNKS